MSILFVTHYTELYGANRSMLTLMRILQSKYAVRPIVLAPYSHGPLLDSLDECKIEYHVIPFCRWILTYMELEQTKYKYLKWQLKNLLIAYKIKKLLKGTKIDVVYSNSITINIGALVAYVMRIPHIWHVRESIKQFELKFIMPLWLTQRIFNLRTNNRFIMLSNFMECEYQHVLPKDGVCRIYNGVTLPKDVEVRLNNQTQDALQLACVGLLCPQKNQLELLKALVILKEKRCFVHAHFIGRDEQGYIDEMMSFIKLYDIENMVTFHGQTDNVYEILKSCNVGIMPSRDEAFGRVTVEYMLMRMPVVASDSGANPELIDHNTTGMIYHLGNAEELADAILTYANNPTLLEEQGERAYQKAINEFSAERNAEQVYAEFTKAVQK